VLYLDFNVARDASYYFFGVFDVMGVEFGANFQKEGDGGVL
jgi:hypothetical protein